jgi:hypothetical protein
MVDPVCFICARAKCMAHGPENAGESDDDERRVEALCVLQQQVRAHRWSQVSRVRASLQASSQHGGSSQHGPPSELH